MKSFWGIFLSSLSLLLVVTAAVGWFSAHKAENETADRYAREVQEKQKAGTPLDRDSQRELEGAIREEEFKNHYIPVGLWVTVEAMALLLSGLIFLAVGNPPGKMLVVAQSAYREAVRQPLFWFLTLFSIFFMFVATFIPYFTLGETQSRQSDDLKMMKDVELDAILLPALILVIFTASISIAEEIEGRTAITLLSKPVSRRQFLLGKFLGVFLSAALMVLILALFMGWTILFKFDLEKLQRPADPAEIVAMQQTLSFVPTVILNVFRYILLIFAEVEALAPGLVLNLCQVMILTSIAVALATRLPMVVNLVVCLVAFFMGRLTHVLVAKSENNPLVNFVAQVFQTLLPGLNFYDIGPAIVSDVDVPWGGYVSQAVLHGGMYTAIALLFGLILFEDRDLA